MCSKKFVGERLKSARIYRGLTITELAKKIGISKQVISQYENEDTIPTFETLFEIMKCLKFPREHFSQEVAPNRVGATYFRALLTTNKKDRLEHIEKINYLIGIYKVLSNYITFPELNLPKIDSEKQTIEEIAQNLRNHWEIGNQPIDDIIYLLEKNGIIVTTYKTNTNDIDAYSQLNENKYIIVLSNNKNSAARRQFDAAHELGHILLHAWSEDIEALSREEFKERENQAHEFASAFLLPKDSFKKEVSLYPTDLEYYVQLKKKWKVSIQAMARRAHQLGEITFNQYQYLMRLISKNGWRKEEPLDKTLQIIEPTLLNKSIDLLLDNGVFTEEEFLQELIDNNVALDSEEVELLLNLPKNKLSIRKRQPESIVTLKPQESRRKEN